MNKSASHELPDDPRRFLAAVVQMNAGEDKPSNLTTAIRLVRDAAKQGARLIVLPEMFLCFGRTTAMVAAGEAVPGPTSRTLQELSQELGIILVAGSLPERSEAPDRVYNTSLVFGPAGEVLGGYRKMHLFDVDLADSATFRESSWCLPGDRLSNVATPLGQIGQVICYDLRFPELFRVLVNSGASLIVIPAAFTVTTGRDHWETLIRARAIEGQCFVLAANQFGQHLPNQSTYGHSMIVDPWGIVLATVAAGEGIAIAEIDLDRVREVRRRMPVRAHARLKIVP